MRPGALLLGLAAPVLLAAAALILAPALILGARAPIGSTMVVDVTGGRDWAVYSSSSTWRAAHCDLTGADGQPIVLRPDMLQQRLPGRPTWYPQGSFRLDRDQRVTASCVGPDGQFAVGRSAGLGHLVLTAGVGLIGVLCGLTGLIMI
ncbi:MAG TPA: hypothetical protein VFR88_10190, partial [Microlunatus sp.]|nr:hypothetical protein [Microlunatus sp.]